MNDGDVDMSLYSEACPSVVQGHETTRSVVHYQGLEEPFADIIVTLKLAHR